MPLTSQIPTFTDSCTTRNPGVFPRHCKTVLAGKVRCKSRRQTYGLPSVLLRCLTTISNQCLIESVRPAAWKETREWLGSVPRLAVDYKMRKEEHLKPPSFPSGPPTTFTLFLSFGLVPLVRLVPIPENPANESLNLF
jgi:hypothetical protein